MSNCNNCNNCSYKGSVAGDAHITCNYPLLNEDTKITLSSLSMMNVQIFNENIEKAFGITGDEHGIRSGWFAFPMNFDPTWMRGSCNKHSNIVTPQLIKEQQEIERLVRIPSVLKVALNENIVESSSDVLEVISKFDKTMEIPNNQSLKSEEDREKARNLFLTELRETEKLCVKYNIVALLKEHPETARHLESVA